MANTRKAYILHRVVAYKKYKIIDIIPYDPDNRDFIHKYRDMFKCSTITWANGTQIADCKKKWTIN